MESDKINMALDDIIKNNKRKERNKSNLVYKIYNSLNN